MKLLHSLIFTIVFLCIRYGWVPLTVYYMVYRMEGVTPSIVPFLSYLLLVLRLCVVLVIELKSKEQ